MNLKKYFLLAILILFASFLRFYKLSDYPVQLNHDEISQLYDTASIVKTHRDIYGNFLPLAFPSTGDYKVGHYIYISTIPYLIFGDHEYTIRIAAAFFGTLIVLAVFLFTFTLSGNFGLAFSAAALVAITPSEIFYSRKSFENVIGLSMVFFGLFFLFKSLDESKSRLGMYLGIFLMILAMYIYTSHTMVVPLLLLSIAVIFRKRIKLQKNIGLILFWVVLIVPLVYISLTNPGIRFRAASVFITQDAGLGHQIDLSGNNPKAYLDYVFSKYLSQFDPSYLFGNGLDLTNQGLIGVGPLLLIGLPLLLLGIMFVITTNYLSSEKKFFLFLLTILPMIPSALTFEKFSPHRSMMEFTVLSIISGYGLFWLFQQKRKLAYLFILLIGFNFIYFVHMYTVNYPYEKSQQIHYPFKQVALYAWSKYNDFDRIIIDPTYGQAAPVYGVATQYYLAYYGHYPPAKFQKDLKIIPEGMAFDKFSIRKIDWRKDQGLKNTLIIASPWEIPIDRIDKNKLLTEFNFYDGQVAFYAISLK